jgi:hypothetical protein
MAELDDELKKIGVQTTTTSGYEVPDKKTESTSGLAAETEEQKAVRIAEGNEIAQAFGFEREESGKLKDTNSTISDLIDMRKYTEESERINRAKALNAGLFNAFATIGDMISAGVGGNVYKRDKDTTAADAAKDTDAKKKALIDAEKAAKDKDRQRYADVVKAIQDLNFKHRLSRDKVTSQTTEGFYQPEVSQTVTTQSSTDPAEERRINNYYDNLTTLLKADMSDEDRKTAIKTLTESYFGTQSQGQKRVRRVSSADGNKGLDNGINKRQSKPFGEQGSEGGL